MPKRSTSTRASPSSAFSGGACLRAEPGHRGRSAVRAARGGLGRGGLAAQRLPQIVCKQLDPMVCPNRLHEGSKVTGKARVAPPRRRRPGGWQERGPDPQRHVRQAGGGDRPAALPEWSPQLRFAVGARARPHRRGPLWGLPADALRAARRPGGGPSAVREPAGCRGGAREARIRAGHVILGRVFRHGRPLAGPGPARRSPTRSGNDASRYGCGRARSGGPGGRESQAQEAGRAVARTATCGACGPSPPRSC